MTMKISLRDVLVGLVFFGITAWLAYDLYQAGLQQGTPAERFATIGRLLGAALGACSALYFLVLKQSHERSLETLRGEIQRRNTTQSTGEQTLSSVTLATIEANLKVAIEPRLREIESQAKSFQKHSDLVLEDDFRRRERRDTALIAFSKSVNSTTRAFRLLSRFRMVPGMHSEQLVNALTPALAARQTYLAARDELDDLHVVHDDHEKAVRGYSNLLIDIIIDVRRTDERNSVEYDKTMNSHHEQLEKLNGRIGTMLGLFLAPQKHPPGSHDRHLNAA